jgi:hypothetical protein
MNDPRFSRTTRHVLVLSGLFLLASTSPSHAYVDPGSVTVIITAVLGAIAAAGYTVRTYWARAKSLFQQAKNTLTSGRR